MGCSHSYVVWLLCLSCKIVVHFLHHVFLLSTMDHDGPGVALLKSEPARQCGASCPG